jgi:3-methyladenine DNA glycosylase AlkD
MPDPATELTQRIRSRIAEVADPARAEPMRAYMRSTMPFRGVPAKPLRAVCRAVYDEHRLPDRDSWVRGVRGLWDGASYREERFAALALTTHRHYRAYQDPASLPLYRHLVVTGAWWDFVDTLASHNIGGVLATHRAVVTPTVLAWAVADDLWLRRTAILCQLGHKDDTDPVLLRAALEANLEDSRFGREFFVRKAIGWALRQHARVDPAWVRAFVDGHAEQLSGLSRREALKHLS